MNLQILTDTIKEMLAEGKGLLAMDESTGTCTKRFAALGIPQTIEMRRKFRQWIITTPGLNESISGAILFDETIRQCTDEGIPFTDVLKKAGIVPGIKVDEGTVPMPAFPNEEITEGLDRLRNRLDEYKKLGARFAKWRAVIRIAENIPTDGCIDANVHALSRYAALCQEAGVVPVVEPEVLMDGNHSLERCFEVTEKVLKSLFLQLHIQRIALEGMILKPNMVIQGADAIKKSTVEEVAEATIQCFLESVPAAVPGVAFLSGGQSPQLATQHLNEMNRRFKNKLPWVVTFSFSRAIEYPAIEIWNGKDEHVEKAQKFLYHRAKLNSAARKGEYKIEME
ncbi:MAG: fructose-bisphosphate aldolase class I [Bacteroidetes bacterium]|nr:fructose-bisphosphate aldolase class I [Bacteroidota bacterium]